MLRNSQVSVRSLSTIEPMRLLRFLGLLMRGVGIGIGYFRLLAVLRDDVSLYKGQNGDDAECNKDDVAVFLGQIDVVFHISPLRPYP